jgi:hypothetical protein
MINEIETFERILYLPRNRTQTGLPNSIKKKVFTHHVSPKDEFFTILSL